MNLPGKQLFPFVRLATVDLVRGRPRSAEPERHLAEAIAWLERAQDRTPDGGVAYGYSLKGGWRSSYVETTGYIARTFFDLAKDLGRPELRDRALRMAHWLCSVQLEDGSFTNTRFARGSGIVFDTGQDLIGLTRAFRETGDEAFSRAMVRAASWLVDRAADETGRWTRHTHLGIPHVYNSRVAWALVQANQALGRNHEDWERVARVNLDWAVSQERNGFFEQCAFEPDVAPFTHTIAYAIRGLWEAGVILDDETYRSVAIRAASAVLGLLDDDGFLPGQIDVRGEPAARYCCLTGNCQMAVIWAKLFASTGDDRFRVGALRALRFVMSTWMPM